VTAEDEIGFGLRSLRKGWAFTVVRDLVQSLVANNDRISGEDLQTLYHLCQNTDDGKSIDERKERVRNLNLPADDIARITEQIEQHSYVTASSGCSGKSTGQSQLIFEISTTTGDGSTGVTTVSTRFPDSTGRTFISTASKTGNRFL
jgi:hypothetical protein